MMVIYGIKNKESSKYYVGGTINFSQRKSSHLNKLNKNKHHSRKMQRAWDKYGKDSFEFIVLEKVKDVDKLTDTEQKWIDSLDSYHNGYNGQSLAGWYPIAEKNGMYGKESPNKGKKSKTRRKIVSYNTETGNLEWFEYLQQAFDLYGSAIYENLNNKGKSIKGKFWFYVEDLNLKNLKNKFIELKLPHSGRFAEGKRSKEICSAISEGRKGMKFSQEHKDNMSKVRMGKGTRKVVRSDGKVYNSVKDAENDIGLKSFTSLSHHLSGRTKSCKGWTFTSC